jgi:serine/threonine protein kinase
MIGQTLGLYQIVEKIGVGGMGEVYCAHDHQLDSDVALKVLPPGATADETARKLFRKEALALALALALAKLNHPNIETVFEFSTQDEKDFLAMELIPGSSLREGLKQRPRAGGAAFRLGDTIRQRIGCGSQTRRSASRSQIIRTKGGSVHVYQTSDNR